MAEVNFNALKGNYSYYQSNAKEQPAEAKAEAKAEGNKGEAQVSADKMLDAMSLLGAQNFASVHKADINPVKLSDDRISDIENSMALFEQGVEAYADAIKAEFGGAISEAQVYSLAAKAFALEA